MRTETEVRTETEDAVRRGAARLDETQPGWRDRIVPGELQMNHCSHCIIGQVFGIPHVERNEYIKASSRYDNILDELGVGWGGEFGFLPEYGETWGGLRDAWIGYIKGEWS